MTTAASSVRWPAGHEPAGTDIHAVNRGVGAASAEQVWGWLVRPDRWVKIYKNVRRMRHLDGPWPEVGLGSRFSWVTFGAPVRTTITEYEPFERLAWSGTGLGARGHHAWVLHPTPGGGCEILTEETQRGMAVKLLRPALRPAMLHFHQAWVNALANPPAWNSSK